jgi:3-isopropylmalate/(R)-2-methylmalate dehydratase small subunit
MTPLKSLTARACPLPLANVDTDQLIPARFMRRTRKEGYGGQLLHDLRFGADGSPDPDFPLNQPRFAGSAILVTRRNFGSGSSREAAVYALQDFGFRVVIAPSFGDIFAQNAVNNGLLPARISESEAEALLGWLAEKAGDIFVSLEDCVIRAGNHAYGFSIDPVWRTKLLNGWDDLDLTMSHANAIDRFFATDSRLRPWVKPVSRA